VLRFHHFQLPPPPPPPPPLPQQQLHLPLKKRSKVDQGKVLKNIAKKKPRMEIKTIINVKENHSNKIKVLRLMKII
jgi:hypothetical protein